MPEPKVISQNRSRASKTVEVEGYSFRIDRTTKNNLLYARCRSKGCPVALHLSSESHSVEKTNGQNHIHEKQIISAPLHDSVNTGTTMVVPTPIRSASRIPVYRSQSDSSVRTRKILGNTTHSTLVLSPEGIDTKLEDHQNGTPFDILLEEYIVYLQKCESELIRIQDSIATPTSSGQEGEKSAASALNLQHVTNSKQQDIIALSEKPSTPPTASVPPGVGNITSKPSYNKSQNSVVHKFKNSYRQTPESISIISDSHGKKLTELLQISLPNATIYGHIATGAPIEALINSHSPSPGEKIILFGGTNNFDITDEQDLFPNFQKALSSFANKSILAKPIIILPIYRYDNPLLNSKISQVNTKIKEMAKSSIQFSHIKFVDLNKYLERYDYTKHGLHLNVSGKKIVAQILKCCLTGNNISVSRNLVTNSMLTIPVPVSSRGICSPKVSNRSNATTRFATQFPYTQYSNAHSKYSNYQIPYHDISRKGHCTYSNKIQHVAVADLNQTYHPLADNKFVTPFRSRCSNAGTSLSQNF